MNYTIKWATVSDTYSHPYNRCTASTKYEADGFRIWKGKIWLGSCFWSADEWHLERMSDHKILHSARTAKECKGALEYCIRQGKDIHTMDQTGISGFTGGIVFNEDFTAFEIPYLKKLEKRYLMRKGRR